MTLYLTTISSDGERTQLREKCRGISTVPPNESVASLMQAMTKRNHAPHGEASFPEPLGIVFLGFYLEWSRTVYTVELIGI